MAVGMTETISLAILEVFVSARGNGSQGQTPGTAANARAPAARQTTVVDEPFELQSQKGVCARGCDGARNAVGNVSTPPSAPPEGQPAVRTPVRNANGGVDFANTPHLYPAGEGQLNTVKIEYTGSRRQDYGQANIRAGLGTTQKPPKGYTWHHVDDYDPATNTGTLQLVEQGPHEDTYPHNGGVRQYEKATGKKYK